MRNISLVYFVFFTGIFSLAQTKKIDSLFKLIDSYEKNKFPPSLQDSVKVNWLNSIFIETINYETYIAYDCAKKALDVSKKINFSLGEANSLSNLARVYNLRGQFDQAKKYFEKAITIYEKLDNKLNIAYCYGDLGVVYSKKSNFPEALSYYFKALKIYQETNDDLSVGYAYVNIGILYKNQNDFEQALSYYIEAEEILKKIDSNDSRYGLMAISTNIANIYIKKKEYQKALDYLDKALNKNKRYKNNYIYAETYKSLGDTYLELGNIKSALYNFNLAFDFFVKIEDQMGISYTQIKQGYCHFKQDNIVLAKEKIYAGMTIAKTIGQIEWQKNGYEYLSQIYARQHNYKQALEYEKLFKKFNDSIFNKEKDKKLIQLKMQFEFDKIQSESDQIQHTRELKIREETDQQRTITKIVLAGFIIVSLLSIAIFKNLKRNQKQNIIINIQKKTVENQNKIIQKSLEEKETLLREIHHRVKNNLQIISSLFNIQSENIKNEKILASIQEGKTRVQAMSLIHQNLYQSEHLDKVDINNYLEQLTVYLKQIYDDKSKNIIVDIDSQNFEFDIETAIPLGLIVNELLCNAYKYAFLQKNEGNIIVKITQLNEEEYQLNFSDDGSGFITEENANDSKSLGLKLVKILTRQLKGSLEISTDNGTKIQLNFKPVNSEKKL